MQRRDKPGPGQESVWDYPRPPVLDPSSKHVRIEVGGVVLADSNRAVRLLETSHPPTWYIPASDVRTELLERSDLETFCEFKGNASYVDLGSTDRRQTSIGWTYLNPTPGFSAIKGHYAFYATRVDACWVGDERVQSQDGDFYGGWVTADVVGPFKGAQGTWGW